MEATTQRRNGEQQQRSQQSTALKETSDDFQEMMDTVCSSCYDYGRKHPGVIAGMAFMVGFWFGWKIKPW